MSRDSLWRARSATAAAPRARQRLAAKRPGQKRERTSVPCLLLRRPLPKMQWLCELMLHARKRSVSCPVRRVEPSRMKLWRWFWFVSASLCLTSRTPYCLAQARLQDEKKQSILDSLPRPQSLNLEDLFKKIDKNDILAELRKLPPKEIEGIINKPGFLDALKKSSSVRPEWKAKLEGLSQDQAEELKKQLMSRLQAREPPSANGQKGAAGAKALVPAPPIPG